MKNINHLYKIKKEIRMLYHERFICSDTRLKFQLMSINCILLSRFLGLLSISRLKKSYYCNNYYVLELDDEVNASAELLDKLKNLNIIMFI